MNVWMLPSTAETLVLGIVVEGLDLSDRLCPCVRNTYTGKLSLGIHSRCLLFK